MWHDMDRLDTQLPDPRVSSRYGIAWKGEMIHAHARARVENRSSRRQHARVMMLILLREAE